MASAVPTTDVMPAAERFNPDAKSFAAYALGTTKLLGELAAATLEAAQAEATARWHWDRGDRLGIRETGHEDAPTWPFDKQTIDRLHIFAVRRSAPIKWVPTDDLMRTRPVCKFSLEHICTVDVKALAL